jgi:hypothetical protein
VGSWTATTTEPGPGDVLYLDANFSADGTLSIVATAEANGTYCTGSFTSDSSWTSTATTLTLGGSATCEGAIECEPTSLLCTPFGGGTCSYGLSANGETLVTRDCNGNGALADVTWTRVSPRGI